MPSTSYTVTWASSSRGLSKLPRGMATRVSNLFLSA